MDYEAHGCPAEELPMRGPKNTNVHPLEEVQRTCRERQEKAEQGLAARTFGIGFTLHLQHEKAAVRCPQIGHLGVLKRHDVMYNSLTGRDLDIDFCDTLAIEPGYNSLTHTLLETLYKPSFFKK